MDPPLLYATVLLAAFGEATAFVGLAVPGVGLVLGAAILAARGVAEPGWVGALASLGAAAGFALSYALGRAGGARLARWSGRAEAALARSRTFFDRHGPWSVFWGHFFGPVRALVAFAAGAAGLPPRRFWPASLAGSVVWGYSMALAGVAASGGWALVEARLGRASLVLAALAAALYLSLRLATGALLLGLRLLPSVADGALRLLERGAASARLDRLLGSWPTLGRWLLRRLAPDRATGLLLTVGAIACGSFAWLFFVVAEDLLFHDPLVRVDRNVFHLLQAMRSTGGDRLFLAVTQLGGAPVTGAALGAGVLALAWLRRRFEAGLLLAGFGLGEALMWVLKQGVGRARPAPLHALAVETTGAFPSNHAFSALALYGFLAYLAGRRVSPRRRARLYAAVGMAVAAVGASRLYLGVHWLSDVLAGYALAGLWLATLITAAEARRRFGPAPPPAGRARVRVAAALVALAVTGTWGAASWHALRQVPLPGRTPPRPPALALEDVAAALPALLARPAEGLLAEPAGRPELALAGSAEAVAEAAAAAGWVRVRPLDLASLFAQARGSWEGRFDPDAPVGPLFRGGRPHDLALAQPSPQGRLLLRLWRAGLALAHGPVWVACLQVQPPPRHLLGLAVPARPMPAPEGWAEAAARELAGAGGFRPAPGTGGALLLAP